MPKRKRTKAAAPRVDTRKGGRMPRTDSAEAPQDPAPVAATADERDSVSTVVADASTSDPAAPAADTPESDHRITVACPHGDTRLVITRPNNNGFVILDGPGEVCYGVGSHGLPICPTHQVEMLAGEPIRVGDALRLVLDVTGPQQAKLFDTAKPFNFEGAWLDLEAMGDEIDALTDRLESKLTEVKYLRKRIAAKQALHKTARLEFKARRLEKAAQIIAAEVAQEAREEAAKDESAAPAPLVPPDDNQATQEAVL